MSAGAIRKANLHAAQIGMAATVLAFAALFVLGGCSLSSSTKENPDAAYIEAHAGEFTLVDVRTTSEYDGGHIPGAINIPYSSSPCAANTVAGDMQIYYGQAGLDTDDAIILYCRTGVRAQAAASILEELGYTDVSVYEGSWEDWSSDTGRAIEH